MGKVHKTEKFERLTHLPLCLIFKMPDVGLTEIDGKKRYITWGRNIAPENVQGALEFGFDLVKSPLADWYEVLVPEGKPTETLESMLALK